MIVVVVCPGSSDCTGADGVPSRPPATMNGTCPLLGSVQVNVMEPPLSTSLTSPGAGGRPGEGDGVAASEDGAVASGVSEVRKAHYHLGEGDRAGLPGLYGTVKREVGGSNRAIVPGTFD